MDNQMGKDDKINMQQGGEARCEAISYQELLDSDSRPAPEILRISMNPDVGDEPFSADRYTNREWHELEKEKLWPKVWQMACRSEEIPEAGDHILYEITNKSIIVVRTETGSIKAYYNSCLHRGRTLRDSDGKVKKFRCPFHGFTWNLDGSLAEIPCKWDFAHCADEEMSLPEARVAEWGGFVFINMDPNAEPLENYLGILPQHFTRWKPEKAFKAVHVQKIVPANWKLTQEAFLESYHAFETHPQILPYTADANSQYDIFDEHVARTITPSVVPSPHLGPISEQSIAKAYETTGGAVAKMMGEDTSVPEGKSAREHMAELNRRIYAKLYGQDLEDATDSEMLDSILYNVFPNFVPWCGFGPMITYRFRPNGDDHTTSIMDVMMLFRYNEELPRPPAAPVHKLAIDEPWTNAAQLGGLCEVFEQDMANLPYVQKGLESSATGKVQLASYQESRIRHHHNTLERYLFGKQETPGK